MQSDKIIPLRQRRETAADVHWNAVDFNARHLVTLSTMLQSALTGGNGNDICKALLKELTVTAGSIANLNRDVLQYAYSPGYDDGIERLAAYGANLLTANAWHTVIHADLHDELRRIVDAIGAAARTRREARKEQQTTQRNGSLG